MKTVCIIQARTGSTRLPSKVMQDIGGATMLEHVVRRTQRAHLLDLVAVATTTEAGDDVLVAECARLGVPMLRGSETDVLDRYYQAACALGADWVVRITSDCPLIDPELVDQVIRTAHAQDADYASNVLQRTFPRGLDTEVMKIEALTRAWREAHESFQRAHVTPFLWQNPALFKHASVHGDADYSSYRWTVDTAEDLELVRAIYSRLENRDDFSWREVLALLTREPDLAEMNRHIQQKALHEG